MLDAAPPLATEALRSGATREDPSNWYFEAITHYVYEGDTALHVAAAAYDVATATRLLELGARPNAANRRGATPLHYACDGLPGSAAWDPAAQGAVVTLLIASGCRPKRPGQERRCSDAPRCAYSMLRGGAGAARRWRRRVVAKPQRFDAAGPRAHDDGPWRQWVARGPARAASDYRAADGPRRVKLPTAR